LWIPIPTTPSAVLPIWSEMTDDVVVRAEGLGKEYMIGHAAERER